MPGLARDDFRLVSGWEHVAYSIADILTTRIGERVMRRTYGSHCPGLIDAPMTPANLLKWYVAVADALDRWEPRFDLKGCLVQPVDPSVHASGRIALSLAGVYYPRGHLGDRTTVQRIPDLRVVL